ncbi:methyl-accepting chemotaxis protein [Billgrantia endophytica]|uniref:Methyl-accepting chemotaxis protein n=1 Tax=Billgrantia endophytica TaxID=2033802 RepID=A0A2N7U6V7_9GAMM|nr:methyl-accepting chemotaxis protein [Halomonas endophytica]PMR76159.1 methyl-accepting chemotaxis protein [Halomonas endophytica]
MKKVLSLRAMLVGLFMTAVLGAVVLAATGLMSNQRLVDSQRFIINDVLPLQAASRGMVDTMGQFGQRHANLLVAHSDEALQRVTPQAQLADRFQAERDALQAGDDDAQAERLAVLDARYQALLDADGALERARREDILLAEAMNGRIMAMQSHIGEVMDSAENMSGRAMLSNVRKEIQLRDQVEAWQEDGMTTLPTALLEQAVGVRTDIAQIGGEVRTAVAMLADLGRQLTQVESADALVNLRYNQITQQINLARQSLAAIAASPQANSEQIALAESLRDIIGRLDELMVSGENAVYGLRQQQIDLQLRQQQALEAVEEAMVAMRMLLGEVEAFSVAQADGAASRAEELASAGQILQVVVTLAVVLVLAIFGWRTLVRVLGPLGQMRSQMEAIGGDAGAGADLSRRIELDRDDEIGRAAKAFNRMMETFEGIVAQIRDGAEKVAVSSRQIAAGNGDLSQRTEEQSASLAETASSLGQITTTVRQTADYAHQAREASGDVSHRARLAGDVAARTDAAMSGIRQSSERITSIITVIDDIAFQTNLLALNASVEAARAGEQGRGFAVVASEVRKLASRSAEEAAQIRGLVADSVRRVEEGAGLVASTSEHLKEIMESLTSVTNHVTEIAQATQEQSAGIEQINQAIAQLDQVTHQNARLVQEATSASKSLDERAADMHALVGHFKTGTGEALRLAGPAQVTVGRFE